MELSGEYGVKLDDMGRIGLPRQLRDTLEKTEIVLLRGRRGKEPCLWLYTVGEWKSRKEKAIARADLLVLQHLNTKAGIEFDKQGRVLIPQTLRKYARLSKDCMVVGQDDHVEIWAEDRYDEYIEATGEDLTAAWEKQSVLQLKEKGFADDGNGAYPGAAGADAGVLNPQGGA